MCLADLGDALLKDADAFDQPAEFLRGDRIVRRIAGIDIGAAQQFEGTLRKADFARPGGDQRRGPPFRLRRQERELVGFGAVEGQHQQCAVVQSLGRLMKVIGRFLQIVRLFVSIASSNRLPALGNHSSK